MIGHLDLRGADLVHGLTAGHVVRTRPVSRCRFCRAGTRNEPWFVCRAHRIATMLSARSLVDGVFQDQQPLACVLYCPDAAQLHARGPVERAKQIPVPASHVFRIDVAGNGVEAIARPGLYVMSCWMQLRR